jgi:hypothetical protein
MIPKQLEQCDIKFIFIRSISDITTNLVIAHQSREAWGALRVKNLDELRTKIGIHRREERPWLYAVFNHRRYEDGSLNTLAQ